MVPWYEVGGVMEMIMGFIKQHYSNQNCNMRDIVCEVFLHYERTVL